MIQPAGPAGAVVSNRSSVSTASSMSPSTICRAGGDQCRFGVPFARDQLFDRRRWRSRARSIAGDRPIGIAIAYAPTLAFGCPGACVERAARRPPMPPASLLVGEMRESRRHVRVDGELAAVDVAARRRGDLFVEARERAGSHRPSLARIMPRSQ